jgi:CBS domain-containing protein
VLARDLAEPFPYVRMDTPAVDASRLLVERALPGLLVVDNHDYPLFILPGSQVLRFALPQYVEEDRNIAAMYSERDADNFAAALIGHTVAELMPHAQYLPKTEADRPIVRQDANLIEVAAAMARQHSPVVAVVDRRTVVGVITVHRILGVGLSQI